MHSRRLKIAVRRSKNMEGVIPECILSSPSSSEDAVGGSSDSNMCENLLKETMWKICQCCCVFQKGRIPFTQKKEVMGDTDDVCQRNPHGNLAWRKVWFMCSRSASESESEWGACILLAS